MFAGVEAGGTKFVVAVGTGPDDVDVVGRFPTTSPDETLGATVRTIREAAGASALRSIGLASFGPVDLDGASPTYGHVTSTPKPGWQGADVVGALRDAFDVAVGFDTDVNGAALGESRWGALQDVPSGVYVTVGTGIGGGAVLDGRTRQGLTHPEMGHLPVRRHADDDYAGHCPYHSDCLEGMAAGPAIEDRWGRPGSDLGEHAERATAIEAHYLAQLAASLTYVLSPHRIVLGGGVMKLPGLLDRVRLATRDLLAGYVDHPAIVDHIDTFLVPPGLGDQAGVLGAIALAQEAAAS